MWAETFVTHVDNPFKPITFQVCYPLFKCTLNLKDKSCLSNILKGCLRRMLSNSLADVQVFLHNNFDRITMLQIQDTSVRRLAMPKSMNILKSSFCITMK